MSRSSELPLAVGLEGEFLDPEKRLRLLPNQQGDPADRQHQDQHRGEEAQVGAVTSTYSVAAHLPAGTLAFVSSRNRVRVDRWRLAL